VTRLILVRHGETMWNAEGRIQGHKNSPLSPLGNEQALAVRSRLKGIKAAAIYSSDLTRTQETIRPFAEFSNLPITTRFDLREKCFGEWEGMTPADVEEKFPGEWARFRSHYDLDFHIPGGETWHDVQARIVGACRDILSRHEPDDTVIVVGHGGSLRPIVLHAMSAPLPCVFHLSLDNAGITRLDFKNPDSGRVIYLNDTSYLEAQQK